MKLVLVLQLKAATYVKDEPHPNLLLSNHRKYDISNLSGQSLPLVLVLFVTLLQY